MKCIYCLKENPDVSFVKTEHVLSQSFGIFENNFTLNEIVCDFCNASFGKNLELTLARGTLEGSFRFKYGVKKAEEFKSLGRKDPLIIKIEEGPFKGAYAYRIFSEEDNDVVLIPAPHVGFLKKSTKEYGYYLLKDIPDKSELIEKGFEVDDSNAMFIPAKYLDAAKSVLQGKGIPFKMDEEFDVPIEKGQQWQCKIEGTIDDTVMRSIAKIALNYLAYWQGQEFVLHRDFDVIRRYILEGIKPNYPLVRVHDDAILDDEPIIGERRLGHLITVNWADDGVSIISKVSLFNWVTYSICLAKEFSGQRRDIKRGHFFDFNSHQIFELTTENPEKTMLEE